MQISSFMGTTSAASTMAQKNAAVTDDFLAFMQETPAQRMEDQWMTSQGSGERMVQNVR